MVAQGAFCSAMFEGGCGTLVRLRVYLLLGKRVQSVESVSRRRAVFFVSTVSFWLSTKPRARSQAPAATFTYTPPPHHHRYVHGRLSLAHRRSGFLAGHTKRGTVFAFEMVEVGIASFSHREAFPANLNRRISKQLGAFPRLRRCGSHWRCGTRVFLRC